MNARNLVKTENKKGVFVYKGLDNKNYRLSTKEKMFCEAYLEFGASGIDAVYKAGYKPKNAMVAGAMAYEYLKKPQIFNYINLKLEEYGFSDDSVEKQHLFLLNQDADLKSKAKAIEMFYRKRGKYQPEDGEKPTKVVNIQVNKKVINIISKAEDDLKKELESEIQ